jgi:hypothetical protein
VKQWKIYAAIYDEISEGFVWLMDDSLVCTSDHRCVVKITNPASKRSVFCEALQIDKNFERRYNVSPRFTIDPASAMVMSEWYRKGLGGLQTQIEYPLKVVGTRSWNWYGKFRAWAGHPQLAVRSGAWLGLMGLGLGFLGMISPARTGLEWVTTATHQKAVATSTVLSVDDVLGWRSLQGDLLGKSREAAIERFGSPDEQTGSMLSWSKSPRTKDRAISIAFSSAEKGGVALALMITAHANETLPVTDVLKHSELFEFTTGTYNDSVQNYLAIASKDKRFLFQFDVSDQGVRFNRVTFTGE